LAASPSNTAKDSPATPTATSSSTRSPTRCSARSPPATSAPSSHPAIHAGKGAASSVFLQTALEEIATAGYKIVNVDTVLVMARPKIVPIAGELRESVARLLGVKPGEVGIKAKTPEGLNLDHVAIAHCTVLLESLAGPESLERMAASADADSEEELNAVVEGLVSGRRDISALGRKVTPFDTDDLT
jgi:2-C-methyl-D-erythritol 2,4-cyclodiphosphate synthase